MSSVAVAALVAGSAPASAACTVNIVNGTGTCTAGTTTTVDTTFPANPGTDRHLEAPAGYGLDLSGTIDAGATIDGFGLAITNLDPGFDVSLTNNGIISFTAGSTPTTGVPVGSEAGALNLTATGGDITYSGNGHVAGGGIAGIVAVTSGDGTAILTGGTGTISSNGSNTAALSVTTEDGDITVQSIGKVYSGAGGGIVATATGDGNILIQNNGPVDGIEAHGIGVAAIEAATNGGTITIQDNGNVISVNANGIDANSNGGDITISGNGSVTSATSGISANATGGAGGDITISGNGAINAGTAGIIALTDGDGVVNITTAATVTSVAGDEAIITEAETGKTTINVGANVTGGFGIDSASTTGDIEVHITNAAAQITGTAGEAVKAETDGGNVTIWGSSGTLIGATDGTEVDSDGGDILVTTLDLVQGNNGDGINADSTGPSSPGGSITVTAVDEILGTNRGISAVSDGGAITVQGSGLVGGITGTGGRGISALSGGGDITIGGALISDGNGAITGGVDGVFADAAGGTIVVQNNGDITGGIGHGVSAATTGAGNVTVSDNGAIGGGIDGVNALTDGSGTVTVSSNASITGNLGNGVTATSNGSAITVDDNGAIAGKNDGVHAVSQGGDISVQGNAVGGAIEGTDGTGIFADATATSPLDGGNITISGNGEITGGSIGINAATNGAGTIGITIADAIVGQNGEGILASAEDGDTTVTLNSTLDATGTGISATATGTGDITITGTGAVVTSGGTGVSANANSGNILVTNLDVAGGIFAHSTSGTVGVTAVSDTSTYDLAGSITVLAPGGTINAIGTSGVDAANTGGGFIEVTNNVAINSAGTGIKTTADTGYTAITANAAVQGATGIDATSSGDIAIDVTSIGSVTGTVAIQGSTAGGAEFDITNDNVIDGAVNVAGSNIPTSLFQNNKTWTNASGSYSGSLENNDTTDLAGNLVIAGNITNPGAFNFAGTGLLLSTSNNFDNTNGFLNMAANGSAGDTTHVGGDYTAGGTMSVDIGLVTGGTSDQLLIDGAIVGGGSTSVSFNAVGPKGFIGNAIVVVDGNGGGSDGSFAATPGSLPNFGIITYDFSRQGNDWVVTSDLDAKGAASIVTNISGALSTIASGFHQPASSFVSSKPNPRENEIAYGIWTRGDAARYDVSSTSALSIVGGAGLNDILSEQRLTYQGLQAGADIALLNVNGSHWNVHGGVTAGQINGDVDQRNGIGETEFDIPFVGLYGFVTNGAFTADLTVRHDFNQLKLTNSMAGLKDKDVDGDTTSVAGVMSYRIVLGNGFNLTPAAGLTWATTDIDDVAISTGGGSTPVTGRVSPGSDESLVGRLGTQLSYVYKVNDGVFLIPFANYSIWRNFENETDLTLTLDDPSGGGSTTIAAATDGVKTFSQYTVGLGINTTEGVSGYIQGSWRDGADIEGGAITGGGRVNF